ncbi:DeoR/GlpR family DNA-binding transcription regulator [Mahella sp.]|uniref:DeoR/GlpR family DNA-binding transcription regulator n=1 Tax=Mahella sp. TaxID=2798721 RepID=UPI0025C18929|nr:DeoR/GlpR family DNA-binding transcription regulator [Mahella sp.]MBZ4665192.1 transcriptional regulator, DeoR family [Mahella sp.]
MFAAQRLEKIKEILLEKKQIDVVTLSSILDVSEVTVRRDLEKLEGQGFLTKTHGGAILKESDANPPQQEDDPLKEEREQIGIIASHMVDDNEAILLGSGSLCLEIAKNLKDKNNLTVVTIDLNIAIELADCVNINIIIPGGYLIGSSLSLYGDLTEKFLSDMFVNKAFIEVDGISEDRGYTINNAQQASVAKAMMKITKEVIIVADYTKFGKIAFNQIGLIHNAGKVITNDKVPIEFKKYFFDEEIPIFTTYQL